MNKNKISKGICYSFENLDKYDNIRNFVSTNKIDVNSIIESFGISKENCIYPEQVHSNGIAEVDIEDKGKIIKDVDALVTNSSNLCLCIKTADCLPFIFYDPTKKVLSVVHAGWKGTLKNISTRTVRRMTNIFKVNPRDLVIGIGPSIDPKNYLVKYDVASKFIDNGYKDFLNKVSSAQWELDLLRVNLTQLIQVGVQENNIKTSGISTFTSEDFYSYRRRDVGEFITGGVIREQ